MSDSSPEGHPPRALTQNFGHALVEAVTWVTFRTGQTGDSYLGQKVATTSELR